MSRMEELAVVNAIAACDRLVLRLIELMAQHEHAASVARPDWTGPHHETFEVRVAAAQRNLETGRTWVLRVRHEAETKLAELQADAALLRTAGVR